MTERLNWNDLWRQSEHPPAAPNVHPIDDARATRYALAALEDEAQLVANAAEGTRNDALNTAAYRLGRHVGAGSIDAEVVRRALTQAARVAGLDQSEIDLVLRDRDNGALTAGQASPRQPADRDPIPDVTVIEAAEPPTDPDEAAARSAAVRERFPLLDWHELWTREDTEEWIVEPILPARRLVALFSAPKVGKSLLMLEVATAVARGTEVLGVVPDRPRRVLYVDFENDPRGDVYERLTAMGLSPDELADLCYLSYPTLAKLDTFAGAAELLAVVAEYRCEVVVIDTISRAVGGEENENDTWLAFYRNTGIALKQAGVACIRLDHTGKDHDKGMRGGSAKYGDVDAVWKLTKVTEETYQLDCTDHRMAIAERQIVLKRLTDPALRHKVDGAGWLASKEAKVAAAVAALDAAGLADDVTQREAEGALAEMRPAPGRAAIRDAVEQRRRRMPTFDGGR